MSPRARRDAGFSLLSVLFLLVALAGLAAHMVTLSGVQHSTTAGAVQGTRARHAALSALEWAMQDIVNNGGAGLDCSPGTVGFALTEGALAGFAASVDCTATAVTEGSRNYVLYELSATGSRGAPGDPGHASRTLIATVAF